MSVAWSYGLEGVAWSVRLGVWNVRLEVCGLEYACSRVLTAVNLRQGTANAEINVPFYRERRVMQ